MRIKISELNIQPKKESKQKIEGNKDKNPKS